LNSFNEMQQQQTGKIKHAAGKREQPQVGKTQRESSFLSWLHTCIIINNNYSTKLSLSASP
jgi:hypothetical protein